MAMFNHQPISVEEIGPLVIQPVQAASTAIQTTTNVLTRGERFRVPIVSDDPDAFWVAEGAEITPSDATLAEDIVTPRKLAGLTIVSRELAEDSNPAAANVVGQGLARDIARKLDMAFFGALLAPAPPGLGALTGIQTVVGPYANLDPFAEAISKAEQVGATVTAFVTDPATALALSKVKEASGSNRPLLGADATAAGQRRILGVELVSSPAVAAGVVWAYDRERVWTVLRDDVRLEVDRSVFFTSDRVAVKATMRAGFSFPHPQSVVRVTAV